MRSKFFVLIPLILMLILCVKPVDAKIGVHSDGFADKEKKASGTNSFNSVQAVQTCPDSFISRPAGDIAIVIGDKVVFEGTGVDPGGNLPLSYRWYFGKGSGIPVSDKARTDAVVFAIPGTFTVRFTVTNSLGIADPTPATIQVNVMLPPVTDPQAQAAALFELKKRSKSRTTLRFENGIPRFVSLQLPLPETLPDDPVVKSLHFLGRYRDFYRLYEPRKQLYLRRIQSDRNGGKHLFFRQKQGDIPVFGSALAVHLDGNTVTSTNGNYLPRIPWLPKPLIDKRAARNTALQHTSGQSLETVGETRLMYFNGGLIGIQDSKTRLAWRVNVRGLRPSDGLGVTWMVLVDAHSGDILLKLDDLRTDKDFDIESANNTTSDTCWNWTSADDNWFDEDGEKIAYPGAASDTYLDGQDAYDYSHENYDFFYNFRRESWANDGDLDVMVHVGTNWRNAAYSHACDHIRFGDSYVVPDIFAHEFTHGLTAYTAELGNTNQTGALGEHYSDVFGYLLDPDDFLVGDGIEVKTEDGTVGGAWDGGNGDGIRESDDDCSNGLDDDGDGWIDEGCRETGTQCGNGIDDDSDGRVDEGCPETGADCGNGLDDDKKATWAVLRAAFLQCYQKGHTPKEQWQKLSDLKMTSLEGYTRYESKFVEIWNLWVASLGEGERP